MIRMIICDDSRFMRNILKGMIKKSNLNIDIVGEASSGKESLEKYKNLKPDIMFLDVVMDNLDGMDVLKEINK